MAGSDPFRLTHGTLPLLVSFPHSGTDVPPPLEERMTDAGRRLPDTDWFLPRLYDFEPVRSASQIKADFSRYVIDPNRPPDGENLYPGRPTPELCPLHTFAGEPIWRPGLEPDAGEIDRRRKHFWNPWHTAIREELERLRARFGVALIFDAHSIRSRVPRLFDGRLPDINIGTANGASCDPELQQAIADTLGALPEYSSVINGRFIGGYITRHHGQPDRGIHAVQLELSQAAYMDEDAAEWDNRRADSVRPALQQLIDTLVDWARQHTQAVPRWATENQS
jgi:N-formylglutamate deformylase